MENQKTYPAIHEIIDLSLWHEFQEGLSELLNITLVLCDRDGNFLVPPSKETELCRSVKGDAEGKKLCNELYLKTIVKVIEKGQIYIYKCHTNQYIFAIPVFLSGEPLVVVVGGGVYLSGSEIDEFYRGIQRFGFDRTRLEAFKKRLRTIPPRSIFTIPNIVENLAVPFIRCLYERNTARRFVPVGDRFGGFQALEEVYRSLAPVLDREELYELILSKSTELVGAEQGSLMILDNEDNALAVKAARGREKDKVRNIRVRLGEGISGTIAKEGVPVVVRDIESEFPLRKNRPRYRTKSFISIPLKIATRVIGVINISDKISGEVFSEEDLQLLLSFANYASIALERGAYYSMSEELKMLSMTDSLTGLFNRRYFRERIFEEVERVKRHDETFTVFMIDIDNFKVFNDRYGHIAGDEALKVVAKAIRNGVRSMDVVARYGGEEFSVILPHTTKQEAFFIAERIRRNVEESMRQKTGYPFKDYLTISLGIAEFPQDGGTIDELIGNADRAMYSAKQLGKNRVVVYGA